MAEPPLTKKAAPPLPLSEPPLPIARPLPVTPVSEIPLMPELEVTPVIVVPEASATVLRTRAGPALVMLLPVPPSVLPVSDTAVAPLPVTVALVRFSVPVYDVVVPSMAAFVPPVMLMLGLPAPLATLIVPPPLISMPALLPLPARAMPFRVIVPVLPEPVKPAAVLWNVTEASEMEMLPLLLFVMLGYLSVWSVFGLFAHASDAGLHELVRRTPWLVWHGWIVGASILGLAGAYQFSSLKYRCLDKCRSPLMFVSEQWRGGNVRRNSFLLGIRHGLFCVGCCWTLMCLMFAVGTGSIGWMLALGAVMSAEKNLPQGRRLSTPLGAALLGWAALIVVNGLRQA